MTEFTVDPGTFLLIADEMERSEIEFSISKTDIRVVSGGDTRIVSGGDVRVISYVFLSGTCIALDAPTENFLLTV